MEVPIKIKHVVNVTPEAVEALFDVVATPAVMAYASVVEQAAAMEKAKMDFESLLTTYIQHGFKVGNKMGKAYNKSNPPITMTM